MSKREMGIILTIKRLQGFYVFNSELWSRAGRGAREKYCKNNRYTRGQDSWRSNHTPTYIPIDKSFCLISNHKACLSSCQILIKQVPIDNASPSPYMMLIILKGEKSSFFYTSSKLRTPFYVCIYKIHQLWDLPLPRGFRGGKIYHPYLPSTDVPISFLLSIMKSSTIL